MFSFIVLCGTIIALIMIPKNNSMLLFSVINIIIMAGMVYVLRGLYFSIVGELSIPLSITGAVVGFASLIGYLPDTFIYTLIGGWLDNNKGTTGYQYMFLLMLVTTIGGIVIMTVVRKIVIRGEKELTFSNYNMEETNESEL